MTMTMGTRGELRSSPRVRPGDTQSTFLARWLRVWVVLLVVVAAVVVAFLVLITNTLANINGNLGTADRAVTGTGRNVVPLPAEVDKINGALAAIDPALKPIPGQADQIIAALASINGKLGSVDTSLKDTSSVLSNVLPNVNSIRDVLVNADDPPDRLGVQNIHRRIAAANGQGSAAVAGAAGGGGCGEFCTPGNLTAIEKDAENILARLVSVNGHLNSVCHATVVGILAGPSAGC
ncbi:MAG: hypothetical protein ACLGI2_17520 [Acidimicrobiia bacterium]